MTDIPVNAEAASDDERTPEAELALRPGMQVEATDGPVGHVGELLAEEGSDETGHFVLQEGRRGQQEVTLPVSAIDRVEGDTVYLKLDKEALDRLPDVPLKEKDKHEERPGTMELVAKVYENPQRASEALEFVEDLHRRKVLRIRNAAVLVKDQDGNVSVTDTRDLDPKKSRVVGAITGGLIGLLAGPVGAVVGVLAGLGAGSLASKWIDKGFSDKFLAELQEHLKPGNSALIVVVEDHWVHSLSEVMAEEEGVILQQTLTDELVEELMASSEAQE